MDNTDISILKNVVINNKLNISIPYNSSANSPFLVFQSNPKQYPMLIHSISLNYDISNTAKSEDKVILEVIVKLLLVEEGNTLW